MDAIFGDGTMERLRRKMPANYTKCIDNFRKSKMLFFNKPAASTHRVELTLDFIENVGELAFGGGDDGDGGDDEGKQGDVDFSERFREILENATPFGLERGHFGLESDVLTMSSTIWTQCLFDKIIDPMVEHVERLIAEVNEVEDKNGAIKKVKYLCIAGGLASSKYFQHRIHAAFGMESAHKLSIRIPRRPILSVIDGALKLGLKPNYIQRRRVKYTYGIAVDRSEKNVKLERLPQDYLVRDDGANVYLHPNTKRRTVRNLFSPFIRKNEPIELGKAIEKEYRRFSAEEKTSKVSLYFSDEDDPYVIGKDQQPLASVKIEFPNEYEGLKFVVQFFFGDTKLRAKVNYRSKKGGDHEQEFALEELELEYHGLEKER